MPENPNGKKIYHCGTLTYTKASLVMLFAWLMWGDFCFSMMEVVVPSIIPLKLKALGCPNWVMGMIMTTLPGALGMALCPWVSFKSDRYRSKWGRRIPFMLFTLPFLCISLLLLAWGEDIAVLLRQFSPALQSYAPTTITIVLVGVFVIAFHFFNNFVGSVFYYLFNDIVPTAFLGRFIGLFRVVSFSAGALYNYFIFQFAESHMREIITGAAVLYCVGFGLMLFMIKEGEYPPLEGETKKESRGLGGLKTFFRESFVSRIFWLMFLITSFQTAYTSIGMFIVFFNKHMGLTLDHIGKMSAIISITTVLAMYVAAIYVDRWHPMRISAYGAVFGFIGVSMGWVWIFVDIPGNFFFWLCLGSGVISAFQSAIVGGASLPLYMRIFPQSRYGQFCSAQSLIRCIFGIVFGTLAGLYIDLVTYLCNGSEFAYRFICLWQIIFAAVGVVLFIMMYREWYRLGGDSHFHPPAPWTSKGFEEMPVIPVVGPQSRWLKLSLNLFNFHMILSVLAIPAMMFWMHYKNAMAAFLMHAVLILPLAVIAWILWMLLERSIRKDMQRSIDGKPLLNGIPHHGMLLVVIIKFLLAGGIWVAQIVVSINLHLENAAIIFGVANVVADLMLIASVWLLARTERGHLVTLDKVLD